MKALWRSLVVVMGAVAWGNAKAGEIDIGAGMTDRARVELVPGVQVDEQERKDCEILVAVLERQLNNEFNFNQNKYLVPIENNPSLQGGYEKCLVDYFIEKGLVEEVTAHDSIMCGGSTTTH